MAPANPWLAANPLRKVRTPPAPPGRMRCLSDDECRRLLASCQASRNHTLRPMVLVALTTGMRKGEILGLRWPDVDLERGLLMLSHTKNGDGRAVAAISHEATASGL